jgi:hypothetical protein
MFKLVKYAIITNLVSGLLYVFSSLYLWDRVNSWVGLGLNFNPKKRKGEGCAGEIATYGSSK